MAELNVDYVGVDVLVPHPKNMHTHSIEQIERLCSIIEYQSFRNPITVQKGTNLIVAGHGRLMAAKKLGYEKVPVIYQEFESEAQLYAHMVADNAIGKDTWATLDLSKVNLDILDLGPELDIDMLGLKDFVIEPIEKYDEGKQDDVPELKHDPITKRGDVWLLGDHRVMCGDSTMIDDVEKLMDGKKADMVFTDPPYNIDYKGMTDKHGKIKNDKMSDSDFLQFLTDSLMSTETMYVCCSWQYAHIFREAMINIDRKPKAMIVWDKVYPAQNLDKYFKRHEIIFYHGKFGGQKTLRGDVWELKRQRSTVHPTMKPVELVEIALSDQVGKNLIYDGFLGSGSTIVACEKTNRKCYGMELDEHYCDVICQRFLDFSGKMPILESTGDTFESLRPKTKE